MKNDFKWELVNKFLWRRHRIFSFPGCLRLADQVLILCVLCWSVCVFLKFYCSTPLWSVIPGSMCKCRTHVCGARNALKIFMKLPGGWIGWSFVDLWYWTFMSCCFCYPNDLLFCKYVKITVIFSVISGCDYSLLSLSMPKRINVCKYVDGWSSDILSKFPWWP